jgi:hypothetical protein
MIPEEQLRELALLYDRFAHAINPFSPDRDKAEALFYRRLESLRCQHAIGVDQRLFRREAVRQCKLYLAKN